MKSNCIRVGAIIIMLCQIVSAKVYIATGSSGWNTFWWINDQPAFVGHGSYGINLSRFVVSGDNKILLNLSRIEGKDDIPSSKFVISENIFEEGRNIWSYSSEEKSDDQKVAFAFSSDHKLRWAWEQGDDLKKDLDYSVELYNYANLLITSMRAKRVDVFKKLPIGQWQEQTKNALAKSKERRMLFIKALDKQTITSVSQVDYSLLVGSKICLLYSNKGALLSGSGKFNNAKVKLSIDYIYFYKKNNKWIMLLPSG